MTFPQSSQPAVENPGRAFLLNFNIFLKKTNFNTLFIDYKTAKTKGLKEVINSLLTFVENFVKNVFYFDLIIAKIFLLSKNIFLGANRERKYHR
jgi:hypothetical protein